VEGGFGNGLPETPVLAGRHWTRFGKPNANHIRPNDKEMNKPWNPMERDFPDMVRQTRNGAICAHFFGAPKSDVDQLIIAEGLIMDIVVYSPHHIKNGEENLPPNTLGPTSRHSGTRK
jgi:hypothetical protein